METQRTYDTNLSLWNTENTDYEEYFMAKIRETLDILQLVIENRGDTGLKQKECVK